LQQKYFKIFQQLGNWRRKGPQKKASTKRATRKKSYTKKVCVEMVAQKEVLSGGQLLQHKYRIGGSWVLTTDFPHKTG